MILYQLACADDHRFESWFRDSAAFDDQVARGLLACPVCGGAKIAKSIMAPAVLGASAKEPSRHPAAATPREDALLDDRQRAVRAALRALRTKILAEGHDVGSRFPAEARLMHDGATPMRPIHGQATAEEAKALVEDGIMILPIPSLPEELN